MSYTWWMDIARRELGQAEVPGARNHNPRIVEYLRTVGLGGGDETAWCSAFVNWVMTQAGFQGTRSGAARSWIRWGASHSSCDYGAIAVFRRDNSSWKGHVGFLVSATTTHIRLLGGNQQDAVSVFDYPVNGTLNGTAYQLLGLRWPIYTSIEYDEDAPIVV
jgi:uncharacterized protein (TIGR02594 family)